MRYYGGMTGLPTSAVAAAYDRWAATYDSVENPTRDLDAMVLRAQNFDLAGKTIVEAGCGTGKNTAWLAAQARRLIAFDFSDGMIAVARRALEAAGPATNVTLRRHGILEPWPVEDGGADLVVIDLVLEHIADPAPVFRHAHRALRPGGILFLCELHPARQLLGEQARFRDDATGEEIRVPAFLHDVSDFVNAGIAAGFNVARLDEWRDSGADERVAPRLLSLVFIRDLAPGSRFSGTSGKVFKPERMIL
jgi:ubiquinone/menaquinone biosynthesis C-methylase UbiE